MMKLFKRHSPEQQPALSLMEAAILRDLSANYHTWKREPAKFMGDEVFYLTKGKIRIHCHDYMSYDQRRRTATLYAPEGRTELSTMLFDVLKEQLDKEERARKDRQYLAVLKELAQ